jgi:hypothetical protein
MQRREFIAGLCRATDRTGQDDRRIDLSKTNNSNNLHCQDAAKAHIGRVTLFPTLSN